MNLEHHLASNDSVTFGHTNYEHGIIHLVRMHFSHLSMCVFSGIRTRTCSYQGVKNVSSLERYFIKNDLIVNLRKGKIKALLFDTRRRLNMLHGKLALKFGPFEINFTDNYKHLG